MSPSGGLYWGPIDAMHQFCEAKYTTSPLLAEFWNALSNIPFFILPGLYSLYRGYGVQDLRIRIMWANMVLVGIGSLMFHGTMRFEWEMLDEMPMMVLVLCAFFARDDTHWLMSGWRKVLVHVVTFVVAAVGMFLYISTGTYEIFVHTFTTLIFMDLGIALVSTVRVDHHGSRVAWACLWTYVVTLSSGRVLWEVEVRHCPSGSGGPLAWLHVAWHALAGVACYYGTLCEAHNRHHALGVGGAVDEPEAPWPLLWVLGRWLRKPEAATKLVK